MIPILNWNAILICLLILFIMGWRISVAWPPQARINRRNKSLSDKENKGGVSWRDKEKTHDELAGDKE